MGCTVDVFPFYPIYAKGNNKGEDVKSNIHILQQETKEASFATAPAIRSIS